MANNLIDQAKKNIRDLCFEYDSDLEFEVQMSFKGDEKIFYIQLNYELKDDEAKMFIDSLNVIINDLQNK